MAIDPAPEARPSPLGRDVHPAAQPPHDVFVSYSTNDKLVADAIVSRLEQAGIRCWVAPRDIVPGQLWGEAILRAIEGTRLMVVVVSGAANGSRQVVREVERAVANDVVVIPFRIESVEPTGAMAYFLASEHWLDAMTPPLESHISQLVGVVQALLGTLAPASAAMPATVAPVVAAGPGPTPATRGVARPQSLLVAIVAVVAVAVVAVLGTLALAPPGSPAPSPSAVPTQPSPSPQDPLIVAESALATGDCLLTPDRYAGDPADQARFWAEVGVTWPNSWGVVPCDQLHGAEVFFYGDVWGPAATWPGAAVVGSRWETHCAAEFERYVGVKPGRSRLVMNGWTGFGADGWAQGLRDMACIAYDRSGADLVGSIRGTGR
jgi:hypothetical protein